MRKRVIILLAVVVVGCIIGTLASKAFLSMF